MQAPIARSNSTADRAFPTISGDFYKAGSHSSSLNGEQRAAVKLLELGRRHFSPLQRFLNRGQHGAEQIGYLFFHHRMAMEAELLGQAGRADFFWKELYKVLTPLLKNEDLWKDAVSYLNEPGSELMKDPAQVRRRVVSEVLIDTHCAFYNGYLEKTDKPAFDNRAFLHFKLIRKLLDFEALPKEELRGLLTPSTDVQIDLLTEGRKWNEAIELAYFRQKNFPESEVYQNGLAGLHFTAALSSLGNTADKSSARREATALARSICFLDEMRKDNPHNVNIYQMLGTLNSIYAIRLANAGDLAESLVAIHKALLLYPLIEGGQEIKNRLFELMEDVQKRTESLGAQMRYDPAVRLNAEGQNLMAEARKGFSLVYNYAQSEEAVSLAQTEYTARARTMWRLAGLAEPKEQFDSRAHVFYEAMNTFFASPPTEPNAIPTAWHLAASDPLLQDIEHASVCAFLRNRLFEEGQQRSEADASEVAPPANPYVLNVAVGRIRKGGEPLLYWFFSSQDWRLKVQAATAILLFLVAGSLALRETRNNGIRDQSYKQMLDAKDNNRYEDVIDGCENFLSHLPLRDDLRQNRVLGYYDEALVRLIQQEGEPKPGTLAHLENYRRLAAKTK
jgi:hypothetical protein